MNESGLSLKSIWGMLLCLTLFVFPLWVISQTEILGAGFWMVLQSMLDEFAEFTNRVLTAIGRLWQRYVLAPGLLMSMLIVPLGFILYQALGELSLDKREREMDQDRLKLVIAVVTALAVLASLGVMGTLVFVANYLEADQLRFIRKSVFALLAIINPLLFELIAGIWLARLIRLRWITILMMQVCGLVAYLIFLAFGYCLFDLNPLLDLSAWVLHFSGSQVITRSPESTFWVLGLLGSLGLWLSYWQVSRTLPRSHR